MQVLRRIVDVRRGASRGERIIVLDNGREFGLSSATVRREGLTEGDALDDARIEQLSADDSRARAHRMALRLLAQRPRTGQEVELRLRERGIDGATAEREIRRLQMSGLLDDRRFAEEFVESRQRSAPRSSRAIAAELRARGVGRAEAEAATAEVDDLAAAMALARRQAAKLGALDQEARERRIGALLQRRGFGFGVIERAIRHMAETESDT